MTDVSTRNFGFLVAYIIPGFVAVIAGSLSWPSTAIWLGFDLGSEGPTVGGFLYITVASVAAGMTLNALRWLTIDCLHHLTGLRQPVWDFTLLGERERAFMLLVEQHYRFHQFHGNTLVAMLLIGPVVMRHVSEVGMVVYAALMVLYFVASRNSLAKYYERSAAILGRSARECHCRIRPNENEGTCSGGR